ncbi:hypothetical protein DAPPUDRAFT_305993 [Daphnia pulex]|uniref:Mini-chromosome maintenance complex-binding protein n=1 Tax=Daphnia pulex TaxID=6669 RepID=E9GTV7_DAPPU|nr:hypothetical protein DAPPUDRAFT_305993 [Daphnia pulex]|eukprot:EFX76920.1 hypothetical protein DAPPUDRAFT_305993 [Daphnia pulex]
MPSLDNWIEKPQDIIQKIYEKHSGSSPWEKEVDDYFTSRLTNTETWTSIPSLNEVSIKDLRHGQLVRFHGMFQDQLGPEMYGSGALVKNTTSGSQKNVTGKFKDELCLGLDEEVVNWNTTESRSCYYCVPIPGETPWVKQIFREKNSLSGLQPSRPVSIGKKRPLEEEDDNEMMDLGESNKRPCPLTNTNPSTSVTNGNLDKILNFPLPSSESVGCIVKIYSEDEVPLNDVLEVVGVLSFNTSGVSDDEEREDFQPPSSIVPRIHCIGSQKWQHNNPYIISYSFQKWNEAAVVELSATIRDELHGLLTEFFLGDSIAADYLLCHLMSRVYNRKDSLALGKLSLNLTNVPIDNAVLQESFPRFLFSLLERLVTKAHFLPMSLENLNTLRMIPKKDYQENRLIAGCLQLSSQTHLVLDETAMTEGQLIADGVRNVTAIGNISSWQKIEYDFNYHQVEFHTDIPVLILSERRSIVATDVNLPLRLNMSRGRPFAELIEKLETNAELLIQMRNYLTVTRLLPFKLNDAIQEAVQQDFIQSRAPGQANPMSTEDFHLLLVLSRLLALTYGKTELDVSLWQRAKAMEAERKSRLSNSSR